MRGRRTPARERKPQSDCMLPLGPPRKGARHVADRGGFVKKNNRGSLGSLVPDA